MKNFLGICILFILSTACSDDDQNVNIDLNGAWELTETNIENPIFDPSSEITISNTCILVKGPCNSGLGTLTVEANTLAVSDLGMTEIACSQYGDFEASFITNLSGTFNLTPTRLTITSSNQIEMTFERINLVQNIECSE